MLTILIAEIKCHKIFPQQWSIVFDGLFNTNQSVF